MNISNYKKEAVFAALYNRAKVQGLGFLHATPGDMTEEEAKSILEEFKGDLYFDYFRGRVMKVDLSKDELRTDLYNRDNGFEAAEKAIINIYK